MAFLVRDMGQGGVARSTVRLTRHFLAQGVAVDIILCKDKGPLRSLIPEPARVIVLDRDRSYWRTKLMICRSDPAGFIQLLPTIVRPGRPMGPYPLLPSLVRYLHQARPDALISALTFQNLLAIAACRLADTGTKVLVSERTTFNQIADHRNDWRTRLLPSLVHRHYQMADAIVAVSNGMADTLAHQVNLPRARITTIYNPVVDSDLLSSAAAPLEHPWFQPGQPPVVLGAGRLQEQKDFPTLIRAFARLRASRPSRLVILGTGPKHVGAAAQTALKDLAVSLGVGDDVDVPGYAENPYRYMARSGVFVLSSAWEGFGNALVEAMACGCPVVATDCPSGPAEILEGGRYGPLVPVGDDAALADAMASVLAAPRDAATLRARAAEFSVERAADRYEALLFGHCQAAEPRGTSS